MRSALLTLLVAGCTVSFPPEAPEPPPVEPERPQEPVSKLERPPEPVPAPVPHEPDVTAQAEEQRVNHAPWEWPMPGSFGMRMDSGGAGWFGARRGPTRKHSGIDLLADIGVPVMAVCPGVYRGETRAPYGNLVQLVCPLPFGGYVSVLYAHLEAIKTRVGPLSEWVPVQPGSVIGFVGKSGNASGKKIQPHLHLEMLVHGYEADALAEQHLLRGRSPGENAFYGVLESKLVSCLGDVKPGKRGYHSGHKFDPFLLLACWADRPKLEALEPPVSEAARPYTDYYSGVDDFEQRATILENGPTR